LMEIIMEGTTKAQMAKEMDMALSTLNGFLNNEKETHRVMRMRMAQYCIEKGKK
jgi:hypothetical protein